MTCWRLWVSATLLLALAAGVGRAAEEPPVSAADRVRDGFSDVQVIETPEKEAKYETIEVLPMVKAPPDPAAEPKRAPAPEPRRAASVKDDVPPPPQPRPEVAGSAKVEKAERAPARTSRSARRSPRERDDDATGAIPQSRAVASRQAATGGADESSPRGRRGRTPVADTPVAAAAAAPTPVAAGIPPALAPSTSVPTSAAVSSAPPSEAPRAAAAGGAWSVQLVGAGSERDAELAYTRAKRKNFSLLGRQKAYILKSAQGGGETNQVRVDAESRERADTLCASLTAAGQTCSVVPR